MFEWLVDPNEGHGLGAAIRDQLVVFAFGERPSECIIRREYPVSGQTDGKGKWADFALGIPNLDDPKYRIVMDDIAYAGSGGMRKLNNLNEYVDLSMIYRPKAIVRAIAVTDAPPSTKLAATVYRILPDEAIDWTSRKGWKLLPLQTIGSWVRNSVADHHEVDAKMKMILDDYTEWCNRSSPSTHRYTYSDTSPLWTMNPIPLPTKNIIRFLIL